MGRNGIICSGLVFIVTGILFTVITQTMTTADNTSRYKPAGQDAIEMRLLLAEKEIADLEAKVQRLEKRGK